jgi:hypothetical protein
LSQILEDNEKTEKSWQEINKGYVFGRRKRFETFSELLRSSSTFDKLTAIFQFTIFRA